MGGRSREGPRLPLAGLLPLKELATFQDWVGRFLRSIEAQLDAWEAYERGALPQPPVRTRASLQRARSALMQLLDELEEQTRQAALVERRN